MAAVNEHFFCQLRMPVHCKHSGYRSTCPRMKKVVKYRHTFICRRLCAATGLSSCDMFARCGVFLTSDDITRYYLPCVKRAQYQCFSVCSDPNRRPDRRKTGSFNTENSVTIWTSNTVSNHGLTHCSNSLRAMWSSDTPFDPLMRFTLKTKVT